MADDKDQDQDKDKGRIEGFLRRSPIIDRAYNWVDSRRRRSPGREGSERDSSVSEVAEGSSVEKSSIGKGGIRGLFARFRKSLNLSDTQSQRVSQRESADLSGQQSRPDPAESTEIDSGISQTFTDIASDESPSTSPREAEADVAAQVTVDPSAKETSIPASTVGRKPLPKEPSIPDSTVGRKPLPEEPSIPDSKAWRRPFPPVSKTAEKQATPEASAQTVAENLSDNEEDKAPEEIAPERPQAQDKAPKEMASGPPQAGKKAPLERAQKPSQAAIFQEPTEEDYAELQRNLEASKTLGEKGRDKNQSLGDARNKAIQEIRNKRTPERNAAVDAARQQRQERYEKKLQERANAAIARSEPLTSKEAPLVNEEEPHDVAWKEESLRQMTERDIKQTALHVAVKEGNKAGVVILLDKFKLDADVKDSDGNTALLLAVKEGNLDIVKELMKRGANPEIRDNNGNHAIDIVLSKSDDGDVHVDSPYADILTELTTYGGNVQAADQAGNNVVQDEEKDLKAKMESANLNLEKFGLDTAAKPTKAEPMVVSDEQAGVRARELEERKAKIAELKQRVESHSKKLGGIKEGVDSLGKSGSANKQIQSLQSKSAQQQDTNDTSAVEPSTPDNSPKQK